MTVTNDFLVFAQGSGANVESQSSYAADPLLPTGNQPGVAISAFNNKALRQANAIASQIAQYIANKTQTNMTDDATPIKMLSQMFSAFDYKPPVITSHLSGSGNHNLTFKFQILSGNATAGATYSDGTTTFTVSTTVAAGLELVATGPAYPIANGTLTKATGTGDATITFNAVRRPAYIRVRGVGGGGGGSGSGTASAGSGGAGGTTSFGTSLLSATGGTGAAGVAGIGGAPGTGGTGSLGTGPLGIAISGGGGGAGTLTTASTVAAGGGAGGASALGGAGAGTGPGSASTGVSGAANTGGGGGGGAGNSNLSSGQGGGAGGFFDAIITSPLAQYAFVVGSAGTAGTAGTSGAAGGAGGTGVVIVEEFYQ